MENLESGRNGNRNSERSPHTQAFSCFSTFHAKLREAGLMITFSSCTVKVSAHAHIYPDIFKFCPDKGLHKTIIHIGNHCREYKSVITNVVLTVCSNIHPVCRWSSGLHCSVCTTSPLNAFTTHAMFVLTLCPDKTEFVLTNSIFKRKMSCCRMLS